jgi:ABC-type glutathione transport system ATPase component
MEARFALHGVSKGYPKRVGRGKHRFIPVLNEINLEIYDQKINALVGESGSGKSTLARLLMGLEDYDAGEILYKGNNLREIPQKQFRQKNQIMFQNPLLSVHPYFNIGKILGEPLVIQKTPKAIIKEKIDYFLEILELPRAFLRKYPAELSGGELQRIVFARTLVLEPEFIILDEPFSALDEIMAARLVRYFKKIFDRLNIGVLYISHHIKRVNFLADVVHSLKNRT